MKKITLFFIMFGFCLIASAQYDFTPIAGPTNVAAGSPVTINLNDMANAEGVPVSSTGSYDSFSVSVDWVGGGGGPWSTEADLTFTTTAGSVNVDPPTTGAANNANATTLTFVGDIAGLYDPSTDGYIDLVLNQSFSGSDADWSNIIVTLFETPTCAEPSGMVASAISSTSATLDWTAGNSETAWVIEYNSGADFTPGNGEEEGSVSPTGTPNAPLSGLNAASDYFVYYRADCGTNGLSTWAGPYTFTTLCDVFTPDYLEDFTTIIPNCWDEASNGDATTGPLDLGSGSWVADEFINTGTGDGAYKINLFAASKSDWILSPLFDLTGGPHQVEFDFAITDWNSSTVAGTLGSDDIVQLLITDDNGATWTPLLTYDNTSVVPLPGIHPVVDLTSYSGQTVQFGILGSEGTTNDPEDVDVFVDNFQVRVIPACPEPTDLSATNITSTSAELSWTDGGSATVWNVEIVIAGTAPTGTPTHNDVTNPYTVTGLTPATDYEYYVQANCSGEFSAWSGPFAFSTECTTFVAPFTEGFENGGSIPLCWSMDGGEDWFFDNDPAGEHIGDDGTITGSTATNGYFAWCDSSGNEGVRTLTSPFIDVSGLTAPALSFYEISDNEGNANSTLDVEVWDGAAWNNVGTYNTNTAGWELKIIGLVGLTITGDIQVRFIFSETVTGDFYDDIAIDDVTIDEAPACIPPGSITVSNITGSSADISWNSNNGETSWEYLVLPAGSGTPSGPGNTVSTNSVTENGLEFSTSYEVWVRADCGANGFSDWAGPVQFDTPLQTNFTLDCVNDGPLNQDYCYGNDIDDNPALETFTFTSSDGTPLNLTFNSGFVESCCDELVVIDTDGTELFNDSVGDVSGLTFQSTGDTISFYVNSDFSVSCESGSFPDGINYTVSCATCINPDATYTVIDDCDNGNQFLIDVNILDLGDASSLTISNNIDANTVPVSATGTYQIGPFPFLVDVVVTVSNDQDVNCVINSQPIQLLACPPDNDNCDGAISVTVNADESCDSVTSGTILAATPSGVPNGSCPGSPNDDVWFEFTALGEQQIIDIQNITGGTFNLDHAVYEGDCGSLTELYCSDDTFSLTPTLVIGNTYYVRIFSAGTDNDETSSFDLCISTLGTPTYCLDALPICADPDIQYESIVGDQTAPPYLDYDCLGSQPDPQWNTIQFDDAGDYVFSLDQTSTGGTPLDIDFIVWGPFVDQQTGCYELLTENIADCSFSATASETITLSNVPANSTYIILITNFSQQPGFYTFTQDSGPTDGTNCEVVCDVTLNLEGGPVEDTVEDPGTPDDTFNYCGFPSVQLEATTFYSVDEYVWYKDGFVIPDYNDPMLTATESGTYQVQVLGGICDQSEQYFSALVQINFYDDAGTVDPQNITVCDGPEADGSEDFDLDALTASLGLGSDFTVSYYTSMDDANQAIDAVSSPYTSSGETLIIRVEDTDAANDGFLGCRQLSEVELVVNTRPDINQPADFIVCDDMDGANDGSTDFDLASIDSEVSTDPDVTITYHTSQADADSGTGALPSTHNSSGETIYVRAENNVTGCYETTTFNLVVNVIPEATFDQSIVYEVCPNATVPITIGIIPDNFSASDVTVNWYLNGNLISGASGLTLDTVLVSGDYSAEITFSASGCTNTVNTTVIELDSCIFPEGISPGVSPGQNDRFDLSSFNVVKLEIFNRNGTLVYSKSNYTDEWEGQTNDGEELPVGTYFYTVIYEGGAKQKSAWVYINR